MIHLWPLAGAWIAGAVLLLLDGRRAWVSGLATLGMLGLAAGNAWLLLGMLAEGGDAAAFEVVTGHWPEGVGIRLRVDTMSLFFATVCTAVLAVVLHHESRAEVRSRLFPALVFLLATGLEGAFFTADLFNFYVFFELAVVSSFALSAYGYGRAEVRGALTYVATNLVGSVIFLIGVGALYHATGTLDFDQIATRAGGEELGNLVLPATLLFAGLSVKLGLFPFHGWVTVLYGHARPAVAAALGGALANIGAYGLIRIGFSVLDTARESASSVLVILGLVATVYGSLVALRRTEPTEIASYGAITHAGYVVLAVGLGGVHGVAAALLTVLAGSIDKPILFLSLDATGARRAGASMVGAASLAGLPLTAGFLSKVALFRAAIDAPTAWAVVGTLVVSVTLVLGAAVRFYRACKEHQVPERSVGGAVLGLSIATVLIGVVAHPAVALSSRIGVTLAGGGS